MCSVFCCTHLSARTHLSAWTIGMYTWQKRTSDDGRWPPAVSVDAISLYSNSETFRQIFVTDNVWMYHTSDGLSTYTIKLWDGYLNTQPANGMHISSTKQMTREKDMNVQMKAVSLIKLFHRYDERDGIRWTSVHVKKLNSYNYKGSHFV